MSAIPDDDVLQFRAQEFFDDRFVPRIHLDEIREDAQGLRFATTHVIEKLLDGFRAVGTTDREIPDELVRATLERGGDPVVVTIAPRARSGTEPPAPAAATWEVMERTTLAKARPCWKPLSRTWVPRLVVPIARVMVDARSAAVQPR